MQPQPQLQPQSPPPPFVMGDAEQRAMRSAALWCRVAGGLSLASAVISLVLEIASGKPVSGIIGQLVTTTLVVILAIFLFNAGASFSAAGHTADTRDPALVGGFGHLGRYFTMLGILFIIALSLGGLGILVAMCSAAAGGGG